MSDSETDSSYSSEEERVEPRKCKSDRMRLPDRIIPIPNADKIGWTESWTKGRRVGNIPHPFRAALLGNCGVGKSTLAKNIILHQNPPFEKIYVIHCDQHTAEYDDVEPTKIMTSVPDPSFWNDEDEDDGKKTKKLVIIDDVDFTDANKQQMKNLSRLTGYCSTHKSISLIFCFQEFYHTPKIMRRLCNLYVLWRPNDMDSLNSIGRKIGIKRREFQYLFDNIIKEKRDSLCVDLSNNSPFPLRKNLFIPIKRT
jgi:hypothetical protein